MKLRGLFIAAVVLLMPTAALAAPGIVTTTVSLRAGPGEGFPTVDRIPGGARVNIHGCLRGTAWCDVSWSDDRGWVSSQYLEYLYRNRYVYLPDYVDEIDVPVVPFVLASYWSSHYAGRPWYQRRAYWSGYWQSHERFATRLTVSPRGGPDRPRGGSARRCAPRGKGACKGACRCRGEVACPCRGTDARRCDGTRDAGERHCHAYRARRARTRGGAGPHGARKRAHDARERKSGRARAADGPRPHAGAADHGPRS